MNESVHIRMHYVCMHERRHLWMYLCITVFMQVDIHVHDFDGLQGFEPVSKFV